MLVAFPIGLWVFSFVCDLFFLFGAGTAIWHDVAFYTLAGGIVGALLAAVPGLIDLLSIHEREMKRIAITHMLVNVTGLIVFAISLWLRTRSPATAQLPVLVSFLGVILISVGGWYGGEMVYVKGMAVETAEVGATLKEP